MVDTIFLGWTIEREWKDFWPITCHCIWGLRNKEIHEDYFKRPTQSNKICSFILVH